jgi:uncharacterized protein (TIGR03437 family)
LLGGKYVAAIHADGTYVGPVGLLGESAKTRPASPGEVVSIFGTGFGPTNPPTGAGVILSGASVLDFPDQLEIRVGGQVANVQFAGLTGAGLYQFNVAIPALPDGDGEVVARMNSISSATSIFITVQHQ